MQIDRIFEPDLSSANETAIAALLDAAFGGGYEGRSFYQQRPSVRFLLGDGKDIIGHIAICYRSVRLGERLLTVGGLIDVAVQPSRQGQGHAKQLLTDVEAWARNTKADALVLFGDHPVYAAMGYQSKSNVQRYTQLVGASTGEVEERSRPGLMVLPLRTLDWDENEVLDLLGFRF